MKILKIDLCKCGVEREHRHQWSIYKQIPLPLLSNKTWEKCKCGAKRTYYENPHGKFNIKFIPKLHPNFYQNNARP
jgi:hypothetical protein